VHSILKIKNMLKFGEKIYIMYCMLYFILAECSASRSIHLGFAIFFGKRNYYTLRSLIFNIRIFLNIYIPSVLLFSAIQGG
jgi:hypothetical protein